MKRKHFAKIASLALALVLCVSLAACSGGKEDTIPAKIDDLVIDYNIQWDYSGFMGTWTGAAGNVLLVEDYGESGIRFELSDADDNLLASGNLQYMEQYGFVYAYNEHDGIAYQCWFDENSVLHIDTFSTFTKVNDEKIEYSDLPGIWYQDGDVNGESCIDIDGTGTIWSMYERDADGEWAEVDYGTIIAGDEEDRYNAVSEKFDDVVYDFMVADDGVLYWGGEYDNYQLV